MPMPESESSSTPEQPTSESTQRGDSEQPDATRPAGESSGSGQVEQSVAAAPEFEATETRYPDGLVGFLGRVASDPFEVNHAVEDLRAMIEATVRREIGVFRREVNVKFESLRGEIGILRKEMDLTFKSLRGEMDVTFESLRGEMDVTFESLRGEIRALRKEMEVRFEALESKFEARFEAIESSLTMLRWMMGLGITLLVAIFVLLVHIVLTDDRPSTPLPQSPTVQTPAGTETVLPSGAVPGSEAPVRAAPGGPSGAADPPADQPTP